MSGLVEVCLLGLILPSDPSVYNPPDAYAHHTDLHIIYHSKANLE